MQQYRQRVSAARYPGRHRVADEVACNTLFIPARRPACGGVMQRFVVRDYPVITSAGLTAAIDR